MSEAAVHEATICKDCGLVLSDESMRVTYYKEGAPKEYQCSACYDDQMDLEFVEGPNKGVLRSNLLMRALVSTTRKYRVEVDTLDELLAVDTKHLEAGVMAVVGIHTTNPTFFLLVQSEPFTVKTRTAAPLDVIYTAAAMRWALLPSPCHRRAVLDLAVRGTYERLRRYVKSTFEPEVWLGEHGLQAFLAGERAAGHDYVGETVDVMTFISAGRCMITLRSPGAGDFGHHISLLAAEDDKTPTMGIQGIYASEEEAMQLLSNAVAAMKAGQLKLSPHSTVRIAGT
jgi:hypothetical protein